MRVPCTFVIPTGVNVTGTQDLVILNFMATEATSANPFDFDVANSEVCDASIQPLCNPISVSGWQGGSLRATN